MAKKKILKSTQNKIAKAVDVLKSFSDASVSGNDIILNAIYLVNDTADAVKLTMQFNNIGAATSTDIMLDSSTLSSKIQGSVQDFVVGTNAAAAGKFLKVFSAVAATNLTPVPDDLKIDFSLSGGASTVSYPFPPFTLNKVGDKANLSISIFFLHI